MVSYSLRIFLSVNHLRGEEREIIRDEAGNAHRGLQWRSCDDVLAPEWHKFSPTRYPEQP